MWDPENFPGADNVPWQLLIRARFVHEVDAVLASVVVSRVGSVASVEVVRRLTEAAGQGLARDFERTSSSGRVRALSAAADFDDWCGTPWPRPWPPRRNPAFDDLADPVMPMVVAQAHRLVMSGGSEALQKSLGEALVEVGGLQV